MRSTSSASSSSPGCSSRSRSSRRCGGTRGAGPRFARESAAGPIGTGMLLGMLGLGIVWLVELPFTLLDVWWARRHDLTESGYLDWAFEHWFELGAEFVAICFALLVVMFLARRLGEIWWIPGAAVFLASGRSSRSCSRTSSPTRAAPRPRAPAARPRVRARAGRLGDPGLGRGRQRHHEPGKRLRRRLRPLPQGRPLEHDGRRQLLGRRGPGRARARDRPPLEQAHPEGARLVRRSSRCRAPRS